MPIHDWTRVRANRFHDFHQGWTVGIARALNGGLLPTGVVGRVPAAAEGAAGCTASGVACYNPGEAVPRGEFDMGEIRVRVKITNAVDEALARTGRLPPDQVRSYEADAMVETGAIMSVIPPHIAEKVGAGVRGQRVARYADGRTESVGVTGGLLFDVMGRDTLEEALILGNEVLIGQTLLEKLDLLADCTNRRLVPNPAHPDQPVFRV